MTSQPQQPNSPDGSEKEVWLTELTAGFEGEILFDDLLSLRTVKLGGVKIVPITSPTTATTYGIALITSSMNTTKGWVQGMIVKVGDQELPPSRFVHLQVELVKMPGGNVRLKLIQ